LSAIPSAEVFCVPVLSGVGPTTLMLHGIASTEAFGSMAVSFILSRAARIGRVL
jgi:hypothetical protein